jgi:exosome complex component CSL4
VIEEYTPDAGTYVQDGVIYSKVVGRALIDLMHKRVSVFALGRGTKVPKIGSVVVGQVSNVQTQNASVRISQVDRKRISGFFSGVLHVSDVQLSFVDSMFDVCKPGDIIRAKVASEKNRTYHLATQDKELGVMYAFCSNCGHGLDQKEQDMVCPRCGRVENRKTAIDYGKGIV